MNTLITLQFLAAGIPTTLNGWLYILFVVAVAAVVIWGLVQLYQWATSKGLTIPAPVKIIFICLLSIVLIVLLFRAVGLII